MSENFEHKPVKEPGVHSFIDDLFSRGSSLWVKIVVSAIISTAMAGFYVMKMQMEGNLVLSDDPIVISLLVISFLIGGGLLGASLTLKDVVEERMEKGRFVPFSMKLLFGYGMWSLILVWFPGILVLALGLTVFLLEQAASF